MRQLTPLIIPVLTGLLGCGEVPYLPQEPPSLDTGLPEIGCTEETDFAVNLEVSNNMQDSVDLFLVDPDCVEVWQREAEVNEKVMIAAFARQVWVARTKDGTYLTHIELGAYEFQHMRIDP